MNEKMTSEVLRTVTGDKAFHFFKSVGDNTGLSASSLQEFKEKINKVEVKSLEFHIRRGDFEKWIKEVLGDSELAAEVRKLNKPNLIGENLRNQLYITVSRRYRQLVPQPSHEWKGLK